MKIIINATNLRRGGALQVALSLIGELRLIPEHDFCIFLSPAFQELIEFKDSPSNIKFYEFDYPSRFIVFDKVIKKLNSTEKLINPDCVFTVFGPTYWLPKSRHIMGFANGIHLYKDLPYLKNLSIKEKLKWFILGQYHHFLLKSTADLYVVETDDVKARFAKFIDTPIDNVRTVPNTFHDVFNNQVDDLKLLPLKGKDEFWFVSISAFYPHKNLEIINDIIPILKKQKFKFKFILTLPEDDFNIRFKEFSEFLINVGPVRIDQCPYLYTMADALFLPTLVESFTASYPEAMKMKKPILTSHFSFAKTICQDAALYFDPYNTNEIVEKITSLMTNKELYKALVDKGNERVREFLTPQERAKAYIELCYEVVNNK